jgi:hypothetical protein
MSTELKEKLKRLNTDTSYKLQEVLINYDEIHTLLNDAGHDTAELQKILHTALSDSLGLMSTFNNNVTQFTNT